MAEGTKQTREDLVGAEKKGSQAMDRVGMFLWEGVRQATKMMNLKFHFKVEKLLLDSGFIPYQWR